MKIREKGSGPLPVFVLGMTTAGLAFVRSLSRTGIPVYAVDSSPPHPAMSTRYGTPIILPDIVDHEEGWLDFLLTAGKKTGSLPVLIPTGDSHLIFVSRHRLRLAKQFRFQIPGEEVVEAACNKRLLYRLAREMDMPVPAAFCPADMPDRNRLKEAGISFPCIIKPSRSHVWNRRGINSKLLIASNEEELSSMYRRATIGDESVLIQEIIPGGDDSLFGCLTYFTNESKPLALFSRQKLRQFPLRYGNGSYMVSRHNPTVIDQSSRFLEAIEYKGLAGLEYKWDGRDGKYKLLDLNPRAVSNQQLAVDCGADIPYLNYLDLAGERPAPLITFREGVRYAHLAWDAQSFLGYRREGRLTLSSWIRSLAGVRSFALLDWRDPLPFLKNVFRIASILFRKAAGRN